MSSPASVRTPTPVPQWWPPRPPVFVLKSVSRKRTSGEASQGVEHVAEAEVPETSGPFKKVYLRLLMREREEAVMKLVDLDFKIWTIEEFFRAGTS